ncbi:hypothetical protein [Yinghuangia seranimata]|uniref:hypothetical protein n=1 Tax=Yinghuangia seranimata TaxID=408067 RepID=UPI00248B538B|nr:hypothetical protein [Yinghuangia seranimata]MDI2126934.1 hypothetical protein [Yinghuangia seranimata]
MFIQVIQGRVTDPAALKARLDRWQTEVGPGATGWLGATGGVTDKGVFVGVVRFASEEDARRNSDRPEQSAWWEETSKLFSGDVTFHDCPDVETHTGGGSDDAGFVQVIQGRVTDVERMRRMGREMDAQVRQFRPDVIGSTTALHGDGGFTETVYFTSEAEARAGEGKELPAELRQAFEESMAIMEDVAYFDLRDPWLRSPK